MSRSTRSITAGVAAFAALAPAAVAMPQDAPLRSSAATSPSRVDLSSPDARDAAAGRYLGQAPVKDVPLTTHVVRVSSDGFDWTDAVIGAGAAFGGIALIAGSGAALRRRQSLAS